MFNRRNPPLYIRAIYLGVAVIFGLGALAGVIILLFGSSTAQDPRAALQSNITKAQAELKTNPKDTETLIGLATAHLSLAAQITNADGTPGAYPRDASDHFAAAIEALEKAYKIKPNDTEIGETLGLAYQQRAQYEQAQASSTDNTTDSAKQNQQQLATERSKTYFTRSQQVWAALAEQEPENSDYFLNWGTAAQQAQNNDVAILAFQKFLKLEPDSPDAASVKEQITSLKSGAAS